MSHCFSTNRFFNFFFFFFFLGHSQFFFFFFGSQPAWMAPSRGHRQHWSQRQQRQQTQQQHPAQQPRQVLSDRAANNDTIDVLGYPSSPPQLSEWHKLWGLANAAYFNRQHRVLWWRILHGCVMCGAFSAYIGRSTPQQACCPFFFFFLGGKDIHYTSAMIATSRVCDVHHKPKRPKLTTHLEWFRHES